MSVVKGAVAALLVHIAYGVLLIDLMFPEAITGNWTAILAERESEASILAALALLSLLMSWTYPRLRTGGSTIGNGVRLGLLTAGLTELYPALFALHFLAVPVGGMAVQVGVFAARDVLAGLAVAWVYGRRGGGRDTRPPDGAA